MGFFGEKCENCGSYNTYRLFESNPEFNDAVDYIYRSSYNETIKKIYRCNKCGQYVFYDHYKQRFYTTPGRK